MSISTMDLTPLLYINRAVEWSSLLLLCGFLLTISVIPMISAIPMISTIDRVDFPIVLLLP
jgi:hypothetical protein